MRPQALRMHAGVRICELGRLAGAVTVSFRGLRSLFQDRRPRYEKVILSDADNRALPRSCLCSPKMQCQRSSTLTKFALVSFTEMIDALTAVEAMEIATYDLQPNKM